MATVKIDWSPTGEPTINFADRTWYAEDGFWVNFNGDKLQHVEGSNWTLNETLLLRTGHISGVIQFFERTARLPKFAKRFHSLLRGAETEKQIQLKLAAEESRYIEDTGDYTGWTIDTPVQ